MGYPNVRHYPDGLQGWRERGLEVTGAEDSPRPDVITIGAAVRPRDGIIAALDRLTARRLFLGWLGLILGFALLYWLAENLVQGLRENGVPITGGLAGLGQAIYFSFVTALSIGYGDVVPVGPVRVVAVTEGVMGLILFGILVSKLIGRRQEMMTAEIHRIAFEDRLGRVRTNLHLVITELQGIAESCEVRGYDPERFVPRIESAATVFGGELHTVHDLLYRPQEAVEEEVLAAIFASLAAAMRELTDLLEKLPAERRSSVLQAQRRLVARLAREICGDCVPRAFAPDLKAWMDRIQELARRLE
jgi:hypothetical protein